MGNMINLTNEKTEDNKHIFRKGEIIATVVFVACIITTASIFGNPIAAHAQTTGQQPYNRDGVHILLPGYPAIPSEGPDGNGGTLVTAAFQSNDPVLGLNTDGAQMTINIIPNPHYPIPFDNAHLDNQNQLQCTEVMRNIATINKYTNALHISTQCVGFDSDIYMEDLWIAATDKVVHVQYQTLDDYTYRLHASDFLYSLVTLVVDGSIDINTIAPSDISHTNYSSSTDNSGTSASTTDSSVQPDNSIYTKLVNNGIDPYTAMREDLATMQAQTDPSAPTMDGGGD